MSNENKNTNVKEETTWTNFKFFNNQVKLKVMCSTPPPSRRPIPSRGTV